MSPERWHQVVNLLGGVLELDGEQRASLLQRECGGDEELKRQVEVLLRAHDRAGSFLDPAAVGTAADNDQSLRAHVGECESCRSVLSGLADAAGGLESTKTWPRPAEIADADGSSFKRGATLGRYVVLDQAGQGGMGIVLSAFDPELNRKVAVKLLRPTALAGQEARARLLHEAQATARLQHPNVVTVYDVGEVDGRVFVAMEFVEGMTLRQWLAERPRSWREIVGAFLQAGQGLAAAHAKGLVHRDFKPDNVLVDAEGRVRVADFGLARAVGDAFAGVAADAARSPTYVAPRTRTGSLMGTPAYMSPEQRRAAQVDARTDQYSFCVALHEALFGERPVLGEDLELCKEPDRPGRVPASARQLLRRGLRAKPEERYPSMEALLRDLAKDPRATRRRAFALGSLAVGLAAISVGYRVQAQRHSQICKGAQQKMAGVWDDARRAAVAAAFEKTGKPFAADAVRTVRQALDAYASGWVNMHTEACEATRLRGEQSEELLDLRMACLTDRRQELKSLVDIFSRGEASVIEKAPKAALGLTPLGGCANAVALKAPVPLPADPSVRAKAEELRQKLAHVKALNTAGKYAEGLPIAREAVTSSQELHYSPLEAETLSELGLLESRAGDLKSSDQTYRESAVAALAGRHDETLANAWIHLVYTGAVLGRYEPAHEAARYAQAVVQRLESSENLRASLFNFRGVLFHRQGKFAEALEHFQRAIEIWERTVGPEHPNVADALDNTANVLTRFRQYENAIQTIQRSAAINEKLFGPNHPWAVGSELRFGTFYWRQGKYELALSHSRRALELAEALLGPRHLYLAGAFTNVGLALRDLGRYDEAVVHSRHALEIAEKAYGPEHPDVVIMLHNFGCALLCAERYQPAVEYLQQALAMGEKVSGADHPSIAEILPYLALAVSERNKSGDFQLAQGHLRRALAIREKTAGPESLEVAKVFPYFAAVVKKKEPKKALDYLEHSLRIGEKSSPPDKSHIASTLTDMGDVYLRLRQPLEAKRVLERALEVYQSIGSDSARIPEAKFLMARALWDSRSDQERAVKLSEQARDALLKTGRGKSSLHREVEAWLSSRAPRAQL